MISFNQTPPIVLNNHIFVKMEEVPDERYNELYLIPVIFEHY